ncbi:MAG: ABC transporter ATP-binding protein [Bacteroidales bacterium]|nr:ABC transporter ATP-binding protein [Bacteroidales bacterium]
MKDFKKLRLQIKPYQKNAIFSILLESLSVFFALFSYTMVIPFLRILFNPDKLVVDPVPFSFSATALQHNLFYLLSKIIQEYSEVTALVFVSLIILIAALMKNGLTYSSKYILAPLMNGVARDNQRKIFAKLVSLPLSFFSDERKGNIMSRMTSDILEVRKSSQHLLSLLFTGPISIIIYLAFLFYTSYKLTFFVLIFLPIMGFIINKISRSLKSKAYLSQQIQGDILNSTEETITGLRIIKAFNAERKVENNFFGISQKYFKIMNKVERRIWLASPVSEFFATIIIMVIMYFGGVLVLGQSSSLSSEVFIAYLVVFSQIITPAKSTINSYYNIQKGLASIKRIDEILEADSSIREVDNPLIITDFKDKIEFENINFKYEDNFEVLKNINLTIKKGETIALVGESGSGKSTLVDLLPRFYDVFDGEIKIDGLPIKTFKIKELRDLFGIVSQNSILFNDTIENNISFGVNNYTKDELIEAAKIANAYDFIMEKPEQFATNIGEGGAKLSGGQKQRLSIARAVMKNPPILILDEATSALDTEAEKLVQDALNNIMKNRTAIVIAHRLSTVKNADCIFVMQDGKIIESGKHDELINSGGIYKRLVEMQMM